MSSICWVPFQMSTKAKVGSGQSWEPGPSSQSVMLVVGESCEPESDQPRYSWSSRWKSKSGLWPHESVNPSEGRIWESTVAKSSLRFTTNAHGRFLWITRQSNKGEFLKSWVKIELEIIKQTNSIKW